MSRVVAILWTWVEGNPTFHSKMVTNGCLTLNGDVWQCTTYSSRERLEDDIYGSRRYGLVFFIEWAPFGN